MANLPEVNENVMEGNLLLADIKDDIVVGNDFILHNGSLLENMNLIMHKQMKMQETQHAEELGRIEHLDKLRKRQATDHFKTFKSQNEGMHNLFDAFFDKMIDNANLKEQAGDTTTAASSEKVKKDKEVKSDANPIGSFFAGGGIGKIIMAGITARLLKFFDVDAIFRSLVITDTMKKVTGALTSFVKAVLPIEVMFASLTKSLKGLNIFKAISAEIVLFKTGIIDPMKASIKGFTESSKLMKPVMGLFKSIGTVFKNIKTFVTGFTPFLKVFRFLGGPFTMVILGIIDFVQGFMKGFKEGGILGGLKEGAMELFRGFVTKPLDFIKDVIKWIVGKLFGEDNAVWKALDAFSFTKSFNGLIDAITSFPKNLVGWFTGIVDSVVKWFEGGILGGLKEGAMELFRGFVTKPLDLIKNVIKWIVGKLFGEDNPVWKALDAFSFTKSFNGLIDAITSFPKNLVGWFTGIVDSVVKWFGDNFPSMDDILKLLPENPFKGMGNKVKSFFGFGDDDEDGEEKVNNPKPKPKWKPPKVKARWNPETKKFDKVVDGKTVKPEEETPVAIKPPSVPPIQTKPIMSKGTTGNDISDKILVLPVTGKQVALNATSKGVADKRDAANFVSSPSTTVNKGGDVNNTTVNNIQAANRTIQVAPDPRSSEPSLSRANDILSGAMP
jgi:hypothetical protein